MRSGDVRTVGDELRDLAARLGVELQTEGEPYERFRARVRDAWEWEADMAQLRPAAPPCILPRDERQ